MLSVLTKMFDGNKRDLKRLDKIADQVEALAADMGKLSDDGLKGKTEEFKKLKDTSKLKKLCIAIRNYLNRDPYEASIDIYDLYHVRTWRKKDDPCITYIRKRLHTLKDSSSHQLKLF